MFFGRAVAPSGGEAPHAIRMRRIDIEAAVANHPGVFAIQSLLAQQIAEQVGFIVARVFGLIAVYPRKEWEQFEGIQNAHREMLLL